MRDLATRYPRLLRAMRWVAVLSDGEALACLRDYKAGFDYSGEAVNHFGGTKTVIERAIACREPARTSRTIETVSEEEPNGAMRLLWRPDYRLATWGMPSLS
jgi:hypothetical protein